MKLEEKLISLRKANGLSQFNLAEQLGVSRQAVSKWEAGASKPSTENLKTLAALYDVPLEYLLNEDDPGPAHVEHHKKPKWFALMLVGIGIMAVILCSTFFQDRNENPVSMNNIEGSKVEVEEAFDLEW